jgi:hypothetical protein
MFGFITALVANEPANIAFSVIVIWLAQRYVLYGPAARPWRAVALGLALGLVALSKMTGLSVGLVAVLAFLQSALATRKLPGAARLLWRDGLIIGLTFLAVAGWWYGRNYLLYGDFFQQGLYKKYFGVDPQPLTLSQFIYTLRTGEISFWATFGWLNIVAPDGVYTVYRLVSRIGLIGVALAALVALGRKFRDHRATAATPIWGHPLVLHLAFPVILAFSLTRLVATEGGMQGRQLLPALGSIAIVIMWGWWVILPSRVRAAGLALLLAGLAGLAIWLPYRVAAPEYTPRPLLTETDLPADLPRLDWTIGAGEMKLIAATIGADTARPGERVPVTLYWQALRPMTTNYSVFVHLFGRGGASAGQFNSYPGLGLRPTSGLIPGQIVVDTYPVQIEGGSEAPTRLRVTAGLYDFNAPGRPALPAAAPDGPPIPDPTIGRLKLAPTDWPPQPTAPPLAQFADGLRLHQTTRDGCDSPAAPCRLILTWTPTTAPTADYTVFIQLWQADRMVQGFDAPPFGGDYPTGLWAAGETIIDPHPLDLSTLPPGEYRLLTGLYNFTTGERLPAQSAAGNPLPDFAVDLGALTLK